MAAAPGLIASPPARGTSWFPSRWERLSGESRLTGVDLARGLAILGMFAAHLVAIDPIVWTDASTWGGIVHGRSSILFATLAGVSIGLMSGGPAPRPWAALRVVRLRLVVRAVILWLLGVLLIATGVPVYVILPAYAVLFVLAIPLLSLSSRVLLPLAAALALAMPLVQAVVDASAFWRTDPGGALSLVLGWHYPFLTWIAFVVAGMGLARAGLRRTTVQVGMLVTGLVLAVLAYTLDVVSGADEASESASWWGAVWTARAHSTGLLEVVGSGGFALAVLGACLLVCRTVIVWVVLPLRAVGAMPLTAYTAQIVAWALVAQAALGDPSDLVGFRALEPFAPFVAWTIVGCTAWALMVGRGPLEWFVDMAARRIVPRARATED
ncbi:heparan-alpha-glucosaminide N-acetyltransferase domain-containing protein [Microbacterium sp. P01]|uniref:heparan-alpha-glucosaminide N-acetyltransferase domain-containing protein n=1 Tax=unclassified Microbacterium TaxID=2609290 RepID=UPI00366E2C06